MPETPNHSYNVPSEGAQDWHIPLNENFRRYDTDIELRGPQSDLSSNQPKDGAKFLATDTGLVFVGDGSEWTPTLALGRFLEPQVIGNAGSVVFGHPDNAADADGVVIGGGGSGSVSGSSEPNVVTGPFGVVAGGVNNRVGAEEGVIGGGENNTVDGDYATVAGGANNDALSIGATVGGGGGVGNPEGNIAAEDYATVAGGSTNFVRGAYGTVAGGWYNTVEAPYGTIAGGGPSDTGDPLNTNNTVFDAYGTVGGGAENQAGSEDSDENSARYATVSGGTNNTASGAAATVAGGIGNEATGAGATVSGGSANVAAGLNGTVPGGASSEAVADNTLAAGRAAKARAQGAFVWGDSSTNTVESTTPDEVVFQAGGGVTLWSDSGFNSGVQLAAGSGTWSQLSSRAAKSETTPVNSRAVLDGVRDLEVSRWEYDTEDGVTHMGPMAEEFADAFDLGADDDHIANVDADGVALAAVQGLSRELDDAREAIAEKQERIDEQADRIDDLEAENEALRERLAALEKHVDTGGDVSEPSS